MKNLPEHLGGHKNRTHLDHGVLEYMKQTYGIKSMLDIGCGPAGMVKLARSMNIEATGIDGDFEVPRPDVDESWVVIHDYEKGSAPINKNVDLVWSCEFVEHVYEEFVPNFMKDFQRGKFVVMTFAPPNTPGHHHVNCNTKEYWIDVFKQHNFSFDQNLTDKIKSVSTMGSWKRNKTTGEKYFWKDFIKQNGLCFVKN